MHKKLFLDFYYHLSYSYIPQWILFIVEHVLFLLNPLDPLETPNHSLKSLKKIRKGEHEKMFCGSSKTFRNISWPINICLKYFMPQPSYLLTLVLFYFNLVLFS